MVELALVCVVVVGACANDMQKRWARSYNGYNIVIVALCCGGLVLCVGDAQRNCV